ncbi:hypothetical protein [Streptomyces mirabilis]|uniref:hypothetical protein n=1 Tax=Streptomyces mirabilis TaxID=68239 RepID=UPI0033B21E70
MTALTTDEYRTLLTGALEDAADANTTQPAPQRLFTPSSHRLALAPDVTIVKGARGTGKTYWAKSLADPQLRDIAATAYMMPRLRSVDVITGFSRDPDEGAPYPGKRVLTRLMATTEIEPVDFWSAVILMALGVPQVVGAAGWAERIQWTHNNPEVYEQALRTADRAARESRRTVVLLFDALDHLHPDRVQADKLVGGLLEVALELRLTTSALRAKIFIRPDMYKSAPKEFADASKLDANSADLIWYRENLYGLLFHQLGNFDSPEAAKFRASTGPWQSEDGRSIAPTPLLADETRQEEAFVQLAGPYMGTDRRKGHTYTWVPNHLQDGNREVSPRTWLYTLREAAALTGARYSTHDHPIHYDAIRESLQAASRIRVRELKEDIAWAELAVKQLEGGQVPMQPSAVRAYWEQGGLAAELRDMAAGDEDGSGPRNADDPYALMDELEDIGVLTRRTARGVHPADRPVDIPDVYRLAYEIGRLGGVSRKPLR